MLFIVEFISSNIFFCNKWHQFACVSIGLKLIVNTKNEWMLWYSVKEKTDKVSPCLWLVSIVFTLFLNEISISIDLRAMLYCFTIKYAWNLPILIYLFTDYPYSIGFCYSNMSVVLQASLLWQIQAFSSIITSNLELMRGIKEVNQIDSSQNIRKL